MNFFKDNSLIRQMWCVLLTVIVLLTLFSLSGTAAINRRKINFQAKSGVVIGSIGHLKRRNPSVSLSPVAAKRTDYVKINGRWMSIREARQVAKSYYGHRIHPERTPKYKAEANLNLFPKHEATRDPSLLKKHETARYPNLLTNHEAARYPDLFPKHEATRNPGLFTKHEAVRYPDLFTKHKPAGIVDLFTKHKAAKNPDLLTEHNAEWNPDLFLKHKATRNPDLFTKLKAGHNLNLFKPKSPPFEKQAGHVTEGVHVETIVLVSGIVLMIALYIGAAAYSKYADAKTDPRRKTNQDVEKAEVVKRRLSKLLDAEEVKRQRALENWRNVSAQQTRPVNKQDEVMTDCRKLPAKLSRSEDKQDEKTKRKRPKEELKKLRMKQTELKREQEDKLKQIKLENEHKKNDLKQTSSSERQSENRKPKKSKESWVKIKLHRKQLEEKRRQKMEGERAKQKDKKLERIQTANAEEGIPAILKYETEVHKINTGSNVSKLDKTDRGTDGEGENAKSGKKSWKWRWKKKKFAILEEKSTIYEHEKTQLVEKAETDYRYKRSESEDGSCLVEMFSER